MRPRQRVRALGGWAQEPYAGCCPDPDLESDVSALDGCSLWQCRRALHGDSVAVAVWRMEVCRQTGRALIPRFKDAEDR